MAIIYVPDRLLNECGAHVRPIVAGTRNRHPAISVADYPIVKVEAILRPSVSFDLYRLGSPISHTRDYKDPFSLFGRQPGQIAQLRSNGIRSHRERLPELLSEDAFGAGGIDVGDVHLPMLEIEEVVVGIARGESTRAGVCRKEFQRSGPRSNQLAHLGLHVIEPTFSCHHYGGDVQAPLERGRHKHDLVDAGKILIVFCDEISQDEIAETMSNKIELLERLLPRIGKLHSLRLGD